MDKISIIVPIYNSDRYLNECIESILKQTYSNIEIILINDGSTDNSGKICDEYAASDMRIKAIHNVNGGVSVARNTGIEAATGEYLTFVDSDDIVSERYIDVLLTSAKRYNADLVYCGLVNFNNQDDLKEIKYRVSKHFDNPTEEVYDNEYAVRHIYPIWYTPNPVSKLIRTNLAKQFLFPPGVRRAEDMWVMYRMIYSAKTIVGLKNIEPYFYRNTPGSAMKDKYAIFDDFSIRKKLFNFFEQIDNNEETLYKLALQTKRHYLYALISSRFDEDFYMRLKKERNSLYETMWSKTSNSIFEKLKMKILLISPKLWLFINLVEIKLHINKLIY